MSKNNIRFLYICFILSVVTCQLQAQTVKYGNNETSDYGSSYKSSSYTYLMWDRNDDGSGHFDNSQTPKFFYWDNDDSKLHYLLDTGNMSQLDARFNTLGVGTINPSSLLHATSGNAGDAIFRLEADEDNNNENDNARIELMQDGGSLGAYIGFNGDWPSSWNKANLFRIGVRFSGTDITDALVINTNNGNVGIATDNPTERLTIDGTTKAEEIIVKENVGADFVFDEDYPLPELEEIENYIKREKHLPEIPTAEEMKRNGVKVGELQMKLLQKIEELTLYAIEQENTSKHMENNQRKLQDQIERLTERNEELTLHMVEQQKLIMKQQKENRQLRHRLEKIEETLNVSSN